MKLGSPHSRLAELTTLLRPRSSSSLASSSQIDPAYLGDRWLDFRVNKRASRAGKKGESARTPESSSAEYPHPSQHGDCEREMKRCWGSGRVREKVREGREGLCAHWRVILLPVKSCCLSVHLFSLHSFRTEATRSADCTVKWRFQDFLFVTSTSFMRIIVITRLIFLLNLRLFSFANNTVTVFSPFLGIGHPEVGATDQEWLRNRIAHIGYACHLSAGRMHLRMRNMSKNLAKSALLKLITHLFHQRVIGHLCVKSVLLQLNLR